jgi:hypothetical protein
VTGPLDGHSLVAMPRPPRLQFEGALYHVYTRGNRRERTFLDDADYKEFEEGLWTPPIGKRSRSTPGA